MFWSRLAISDSTEALTLPEYDLDLLMLNKAIIFFHFDLLGGGGVGRDELIQMNS